VARYAVEQLREETISLETAYVNCWEDHSRYQCLYRLLDGLGSTLDVHRQSTPTDVLLSRIREGEGPCVAILDEVDQLADKSLLYDLYRIQDLSLILIANDEIDLFGGLDDRLNSRLSTGARIRFSSYHDHELASILSDRVRWGLEPDVVTEAQIKQISDTAAGDARVAIGVLRNAARTARADGTGGITEVHIQSAISDARREIRQQTLDKLTRDQLTVYNILEETGPLKAGALYEQYRKQMENPKTKRTVRNYLQKLEHYNLVASSGENRGREYRAQSRGEE
jgi:ORC complex protein Cdc6/Orc1